MVENYIIIYVLITTIFSYIVSFYLAKRFPGSNDINQKLDLKKIESLEGGKVHKLFSKVSLYKYNRITTTLFIFFFNIAIPFLGYIFTLWIIWYFVHVKYVKKVVFTNILDLDEFKNTFIKVERIFGEGSMLNLINNQYTSKSKKLRALAILAATPSPASLDIIKQTLFSTDDEIRLYGYSILNNLEKKINSKINTNIHIVNDTKNDEETIAQATMALAFSYWELVYMELSHESLKNNFLNSAIQYIQQSKEYYLKQIEIEHEKSIKSHTDEHLTQNHEKAATLFTLMGRIYLYRKNYEDAQTEFTIANNLLPENSTHIIPYLAEVYYNVKKYNITKSVLNQYDSLKFNTKLYPIIKQWEQISA